MLLNCDLGESYGNWRLGHDARVMPHIDQANIACGFHAGDPLTLQRTLALAAEHGVSVGAHPAYPDLVGFGRRSMRVAPEELRALLHYQISALDGMAACAGLSLSYVKPHGALYNDMMADEALRQSIMQSVAEYHRPLALMLQATAESDRHRSEAQPLGLALLFEAFADRCYDDSGQLLGRHLPGAVHDSQRTLEQAQRLAQQGEVLSLSGRRLRLEADTLCVHGDNAEGIQVIEQIRRLLEPVRA